MIDKHSKKQEVQKRNKKNWRIFRQVQDQLDNIESAREFEEEVKQSLRKQAPKEEEQVWSAKVGEIRNKLTDRKRASAERWNRFAGTSGGGGRGL